LELSRIVAFAVLNSGLAIPDTCRRQDVFLQALIDATEAIPREYAPNDKPIFVDARGQCISVSVMRGA
jgi:hypothetical protein